MDTQDRRLPRYSKKTKNNQALLRLLVAGKDFAGEPRRYAQSTSGRTSSTGTAPPLSRSSAIAVDSAIRSFVDSAFRRYPSVVPQREAYDSCFSRESELRYVRKESIDGVLPDSNVLAIPSVHSIDFKASYDERMLIRDIRKRRLQQLVEAFGGQTALAKELGVEQNYISKLLRPGTPFGEKAATRIEHGARKPDGWLSVESGLDEPRPLEWPFSFNRELWYRLPPEQRQEIENSIYRQILGAGLIDHATTHAKKRTRL
jgi:hypothetical protein